MAIAGGLSVIDHPREKEARVTVTLTGPRANVVFRHSPYPEVIQSLPSPEPGSISTAMRVLESVTVGRALQLRVEGIPGRSYRLEIKTPWPVHSVGGSATAINPKQDDRDEVEGLPPRQHTRKGRLCLGNCDYVVESRCNDVS